MYPDVTGIDGKSDIPAVQQVDARQRGVDPVKFWFQRFHVRQHHDLPAERLFVHHQRQRFRRMASNILRTV